MARMVSGSVGEISAPKYSVSRNVKLDLFDMSCTKPYMSPPISNADKVVPTIANVRIVPRLRKKYFRFRLQSNSDYFHIKVDFLNEPVAGVEDNGR